MTPNDPLPNVVRAALSAADPTPDAELLRRYVAGDTAAFELLVRRHAGLVWAVCRAAIPADRHTAEDAFQAAFFVLSRKASGVREHLPGWLYQVARRAALRARKRAAGRTAAVDPRTLGGVADRPDPAPAPDDLSPLLHAEIDRLGPSYRDPVLLCYFEGLTHVEAADRLGWPPGTVSSRLSRAKELLRGRLARRGVTLSAAGVGLALLVPAAGATGPGVVRACVSAAAGGATPAGVQVLAQGVLHTMRMAKLKLVAGLAAVGFGLVGTGTLVAVSQARQAAAPPLAPGKTAALAPGGQPDAAWNLAGDVPSVFPDIKPDRPLPPFDGLIVLDTDPLSVKLGKSKLRYQLGRYRTEDMKLRQGKGSVDEVAAVARDIGQTMGMLPELTDWRLWRIAAAKNLEAFVRQAVADGKLPATEIDTAVVVRIEAEQGMVWNGAVPPVGVTRRVSADPEATQKRLELLKEAVRHFDVLMEAGNWPPAMLGDLMVLHRDWYDAAGRVHGTSPEMVAETEAIERSAAKLETLVRQRTEAGTLGLHESTRVQAHRQLVKLLLAELKARVK